VDHVGRLDPRVSSVELLIDAFDGEDDIALDERVEVGPRVRVRRHDDVCGQLQVALDHVARAVEVGRGDTGLDHWRRRRRSFGLAERHAAGT
jgi:hypothetical protein